MVGLAKRSETCPDCCAEGTKPGEMVEMKAPQCRQGQWGRKKKGRFRDGSTGGFGSQDILDTLCWIGRGDWRMIGTQKAAWHENVFMLPTGSRVGTEKGGGQKG